MNPLTGVLGESWRMYRAHLPHFLAIAFIVYLGAAIVDAAVSAAHGFIVPLIGSVITTLAVFLVQAALVDAVQDVRDGRVDLSVGKTLQAAVPAVLPAAAAGLLAGIAITIGLVLLVVPGLIMITFWAVLIPVVVIERSTVLGAFGRSRQLVRGQGWPVFGTLVLLWIIYIVADIVIGLLLTALPLSLSNGLSTLVTGTLVVPFLAIAVTLIYYRLAGTPLSTPDRGYAKPPF